MKGLSRESPEATATPGGSLPKSPSNRGVNRCAAGTMKISIGMTMREIEKEVIKATLSFHCGNKPRAAEMLDISLKSLYDRLDRHDIPKSFGQSP